MFNAKICIYVYICACVCVKWLKSGLVGQYQMFSRDVITSWIKEAVKQSTLLIVKYYGY